MLRVGSWSTTAGCGGTAADTPTSRTECDLLPWASGPWARPGEVCFSCRDRRNEVDTALPAEPGGRCDCRRRRLVDHAGGGRVMAERAEVELEVVKRELFALREALEASRDDAAAAGRRAAAERQGEIEQLQDAITALRAEMVRQRDDLLAALQATERDNAAEVEQLRDAVVAARRHADELRQQHDAALTQQVQQFETERRHLHGTITELRRRLETMTPDAQR